MDVTHALNGLHAYFNDRDNIIAEGLAKKFKLDKEDVMKAIDEIVTEAPTKTIKPQARQPKNKAKKTDEIKHVRSGYIQYCSEHRDEVKDLLIRNKESRTFQNKKGETITFTDKDFGNEGPNLIQTHKKLASMWSLLTEQEKETYNKKAKETIVEPKPKKVTKGKKNDDKTLEEGTNTIKETKDSKTIEENNTIEEEVKSETEKEMKTKVSNADKIKKIQAEEKSKELPEKKTINNGKTQEKKKGAGRNQ